MNIIFLISPSYQIHNHYARWKIVLPAYLEHFNLVETQFVDFCTKKLAIDLQWKAVRKQFFSVDLSIYIHTEQVFLRNLTLYATLIAVHEFALFAYLRIYTGQNKHFVLTVINL